eukprot:9493672-Pyramimonas_sp.AAC.2
MENREGCGSRGWLYCRVWGAHKVVGALVEVAHARNVVLAVLANDVAVVPDDHCGVPDGRPVLLRLGKGCARDHLPNIEHLHQSSR